MGVCISPIILLWTHVLILSSQGIRHTDEGLSVYVSHNRGRDSMLCGSQPTNPCKTIAMGVWRVQHNGRVYVDGTGSEVNPYPCKSSALEIPGIHSNKSMVIIGVQSIPHVRCQEGYDIRLNQSLLDLNGTTVKLMNLQFVNTSVSAQDISLYIDNCIFTDALLAVNLVQSTGAVSLSFNSSLCTNMSSCIVTSITQRLTPENKVSINVTNSNVTTSWYRAYQQTPGLSSGIHVTSVGEYEPGSITCHISLRNVTFKHNILGPNGIILLDLENAITSLYLEEVVFYEIKTTDKYFHMINILNSYIHDIVVYNTKFLQNYQSSCGGIQVNTKNKSSLFIVNSQFEKFQTERNRLLYLNTNHGSEVYIERTTFTSNTAMENEASCLSLNGGLSSTVTIKDSTFINNSAATSCAGLMWLYAKTSIVTTIQGCHLESNSAKDSAALLFFLGSKVITEITNSKIIGTTSYRGGGVIYIGPGCGHLEEGVNNVTLVFRNVQIMKGLFEFDSQSTFCGGIAGINAGYGSITVQDSIMRDDRAIALDIGYILYAFFVDSPALIGLQSFDVNILNSTVKNKYVQLSNSYRFLACIKAREVTFESSVIDTFGGGLQLIDVGSVVINNSIINKRYINNTSGYNYLGNLMDIGNSSSLKITSSLFESDGTEGGCLNLPNGIYDVHLRNVTFRNCTSRYDGAAIVIKAGRNILIESCTFLDNKATGASGGAISFPLSSDDEITNPGCIGEQDSDSHRVWSYNTSVMIKNTIFANNTAISGGALFLSRGNYTIQNCSFSDNFANIQGGHIFVTSESTSITITNSSFLQKRSSVKVPEKKKSFDIKSFIDFQSEGTIRIYDSKFVSSTSPQGLSNTLVTVSKANYVNFGENNQTVLTCPRGSRLDLLNFTTKINTEYKSHKCKILMNVLQFICKPCEIGTYSLQHGQSLGITLVGGFECLPCPFGADCLNKISAKPNFWGFKVQKNPTALNFTFCPVGYCEQPDKHDFVDYNSCHGNRTGILCGKCKKNFTETLLSPSCHRDDECRDTWLWGVAVVMALLMALYLVNKQWLFGKFKSHTLWFRKDTNQNKEELFKDESDGYLKIIFYFYQVTNILLVTTSYSSVVDSYLLQPVVGLFNFEIRLSARGLLCPFIGLTAVTKQLLLACPVFGVLFMIAVCYGCHCLLFKCKSKPSPTLGPYLGAALETLLLGYAVLVNTTLKLLRCTSLGDLELRLFIAGDKPCYQWWQYVLMVYVVFVVIPFIVTLALGSRWLYKGLISVKEFLISCVIPLPYLMYKLMSLFWGSREPSPEPPEWKASVTAVLYGPFRYPQEHTNGAIYWESILIFRRLVLIIIYVFVHDPLSKEVLLTFSCVVILFHHSIVRPFRSQAANITEMISLLSLVAIATINAFKASFQSFGQVPQGPLKSFLTVFNWIQVIILSILPVLFVLVVVATVVSQLIRLVIKVWSVIKCSCIQFQSRGWHVNYDVNHDDEVRRLLEPNDAFEDSYCKT